MKATRPFLLFALTAAPLLLLAQEGPAEVRNLAKITALNPGLSYEARLAPYQTLRGHLFLGLNFGYSYSSSLGTNYSFYFAPGLGAQYRNYYNARRRAEAGKRTGNNNLNYIGVWSQFIRSPEGVEDGVLTNVRDSSRGVTSIGLIWGLQRNYPKHFSLDLNIGPGYYFTRTFQSTPEGYVSESRFTLVGEITLGFWLNRKRKN